MLIGETRFPEAKLLTLDRLSDDRGYFARTMCTQEFSEHGMESQFVQQNTSLTLRRGTLRGLHYQTGPHAEAKVVRCLRGAVLDVIVDVRPDSPTYLQHDRFELSADNAVQVYVPRGFAHGFQSLVDDVELSYLVTTAYTPEAERGLRYDDPAIGIEWPLPVTTISVKDANWPLLTEEQMTGSWRFPVPHSGERWLG